jgi:hypothetical protein
VPVVRARVAGQAILRLVEEQSGLHLDALVEHLTNASAVDTIYSLIAVGGWPERAVPNCAKPIDAARHHGGRPIGRRSRDVATVG